jgi:hypothetical protein
MPPASQAELPLTAALGTPFPILYADFPVYAIIFAIFGKMCYYVI